MTMLKSVYGCTHLCLELISLQIRELWISLQIRSEASMDVQIVNRDYRLTHLINLTVPSFDLFGTKSDGFVVAIR